MIAPKAAPPAGLRWRVAQFFEIRWWKRYLSRRDKGEYLGWKRKYWSEFIALGGVGMPDGSRVLEAGCGPAGIFIALEETCRVDAVDPLLDRYEEAFPHFRRADHPRVHFFCQTLESFAAAEPYDAVFCLNAINHVDDLDAGFDRLAALTKPGGLLAVSIDAHNHGWLKPIFRLIPGDLLHPHQYDLAEYAEMLTRRGLKVERSVLVKKELIFDYYLIVATKPL